MYQFSDEMRRAYESQPAAFVYYQSINGNTIPLLVSDGFCKQIGKDRENAMNWLKEAMFERIHPDDVGKVLKNSEDFANHRSGYDVIFRSRHENDYHFIHALGQWQIMPDGTELAMITYADLTAVEGSNEQATRRYQLFQRDEFYTDGLTGLPNMNYFNRFAAERIHAIRTEKRQPMVVYLDVAAMRSYNSQYGFSAGNELLRQIVSSLKKYFPDSLLVRGSDDDFILVDASVGNRVTGEKIREADAEICRNAFGKTMGIRAGICNLEEQNRIGDGLDHAKHAIRTIKNDMNRTYHYYSKEDSEQYRKERYILENFSTALEKGWIRVYYQSVQRVQTGKIASLEALARWIDPVRGVLSPSEFIPVLKKYHLMNKLDLFMAEQVCREIPMRVQNKLPLVPVSVNFSAQDFDYADIPAELDKIYHRYYPQDDSKSKFLIVEITEQDMVTATARFSEQLRKLRENGFHIWLDDFGSEYSSLNAFSRFEIDLIKFDLELLLNYNDENGANRMIMKSMTEIAKQLGINTLAEGLETEEQREFLKEIGCDFSQGYLFQKPEPLEVILERLGGGENARPCETPQEREIWKNQSAKGKPQAAG